MQVLDENREWRSVTVLDAHERGLDAGLDHRAQQTLEQGHAEHAPRAPDIARVDPDSESPHAADPAPIPSDMIPAGS